MATLTFTELCEAVAADPRYESEWEMGAPANRALAIKFSDGPRSAARSQTLQSAGLEFVVLDLDADGQVLAIEIAS